MSRIRFEWDVESQQIERFDSEDLEAKRRRRRNIMLLAALVGLLLAVIALILLFVRQRIYEVETLYAQLLQDTVKAEVAALRIGDLNSFLNLQDSADADWMNRQRLMFQRYSDLKSSGAIELTGSILAVDIAAERARALVQEDINKLPYARLWFYRRNGDGWRRVAPDFSFWGEPDRIESSDVHVNFRGADRELARQVGAALQDWIASGCAILDCGELPKLTVDIDPEAASEIAWINEPAMRLQIRSPYVDIARADTPFDGRLQLLASRMLAERLINAHTDDLAVAYPHDAYFLRGAAINWLSEVFTRLDSGALLMRSLAENYGNDKVALMLTKLSATSDMSILEAALEQPLAGADLDWRDFIEWRLALENELLSARRQNEWLSLYDTSDESVRLVAYERYSRGDAAPDYRVIDQLIWSKPDGSSQLRVTAQARGAQRRGRDHLVQSGQQCVEAGKLTDQVGAFAVQIQRRLTQEKSAGPRCLSQTRFMLAFGRSLYSSIAVMPTVAQRESRQEGERVTKDDVTEKARAVEINLQHVAASDGRHNDQTADDPPNDAVDQAAYGDVIQRTSQIDVLHEEPGVERADHRADDDMQDEADQGVRPDHPAYVAEHAGIHHVGALLNGRHHTGVVRCNHWGARHHARPNEGEEEIPGDNPRNNPPHHFIAVHFDSS